MLTIKYIRENADKIRRGAVHKNFDPAIVDKVLSADEELKPIKQELERLQAERNSLSKLIPQKKGDEQETLKEKVKSLKSQMDELTEKVKTKQTIYDELMLLVPAPARDDVPIGKDDSQNVQVRTWGEIPKFDFTPLSHIDLGEKRGWVDTERGVKLAGSRSYVLCGELARLEQAVLRYTFDKLCAKGYMPLSIPVLVREEAMINTGYFPLGREQAYFIEKDQLALVGTSEVSLTSYHSGEMLDVSELPKRYFAQSSCFRREAGSYGKDTKGLYRVHQFQKVEQVIIAPNDVKVSEQMHAELLGNAEEILQDFGLPYRVVYVCTGDLGQGQVRKHDIETWMPSRNGYGETHSCSTFHDFQANRLNLRYKDENKDKHVCHTLNNTAIASPRVLIPLLENLQTKDGQIRIPACLQSYMGGQKLI